MATTLTAWTFPNVDDAERTIRTLESLQTQRLITIQDAATVSWQPGHKKPKTRQLHNLAGTGAAGGAFWGLLFGLLFFVPLLGAALGAGIGALTGSLADVGIDDGFINRVKERVIPGTSALFLLSSDAVVERVREALQGFSGELVASNLTAEQEEKLRDVFGPEH